MNDGTRSKPQSADEAYRTCAVIALAFVTGPTLFGAAALWLNGGTGTMTLDLMTVSWGVMAPVVLLTAFVAWGRMVEPHLPALGQPASDTEVDRAALQSGLISVWALFEGQALFGLVVYFLNSGLIPLAGLGLLWSGILITRPRRRWFGR